MLTTIRRATANRVAAVYEAAKKGFTRAAAGVATATCAVENWAVGGVSFFGAAALTKPGISQLLRPLLRQGGAAPQRGFDGHVLGRGCQKKGADNPSGVMPAGCRQTAGSRPKISYVNGIGTPYTQTGRALFSDGICKTMQEVANSTCSEITGVYNATEGFGKDVDECLDNIAKARRSKAVRPLRDMMVEAARKGRPLTVFAHSQGGLITQEAVTQAKRRLMDRDGLTMAEAEQKLDVVSIKSFGTASMGWPRGPHYERFTNSADPVPPLIAGAQTSFPTATWKDSASADEHHVFTAPHLNPFDSHSMDDTYLLKFRELKGAPSCACKAS